jgi:predicted butyrate kinase (DUF1464 family)
VWTLGVDYGTGSWKMALLEEGETRQLLSLSTMDEAVDYVVAQWTARPGLPIALPSGFGVPVMHLSAAGRAELFAMSLLKGDPARGGLGLFLARLQAAGVDGYCLPAVKLLPTVPAARTLNKIDMGTSDKLCATAYLLAVLHDMHGARYEDLSFLSLEMGFAFKCWLVVSGGRIVDGIGGTAGTPGPRARGAIDGELAYLHGFAEKADIYSGGWADLRGSYGEEIAARAFWEGLEMERAALCGYYGLSEVIVSGRRRAEVLARWQDLSYGRVAIRPYGPQGLRQEPPPPMITDEAGKMPAPPGHVQFRARAVHEDEQGFEPALGGALLADGLAGGRQAALVEHLRLREASGHPLDHIVWGRVARP